MSETGGFTVAVDGPTVRMSGELDLTAVPQIDQAITELLAHAPPWTLDLREATFFDSSALKSLLRARRYAAEREGRLIAMRPEAPGGMRAFEMAAIDSLFTWVD